jgi:hypothetical protein
LASTKQVSLRLPLDVVAWLEKRAKADTRSLAFIAAAVIRGEMAREAKRSTRRHDHPAATK